MQINKYIERDLVDGSILLNGKWGSGKTWLVENDLVNKIEREVLKISAYGIKNHDDIYSKIDQQFKIGGFLSKNISTTYRNNLILERLTKDSKKMLLVIDDIERIDDFELVLSFVNDLVTLHDMKVLLVGNEEEIYKNEKSDDDRFQYKRYKEKTISSVLNIEPDFESTLLFTITKREEKYGDFQNALLRNKEVLLYYLKEYGENNLRTVSYFCIICFEFYDSFERQVKNDAQFIDSFLKVTFLLCCVLRKGTIKESELNQFFKYTYNKEDKPKTEIEIIKELLFSFRPDLTYSFYELYNNYFIKGKVDKDLLRKSLFATGRFYQLQEPNWLKLTFISRFNNQEDLEAVFYNVLDDFENLKIVERGSLLHVISSFVFIKKHSLINNTKVQNLEDTIDKNLEKIMEQRLIQFSESDDKQPRFDDSSHNVQYLAIEEDSFLKYKTKINEHQELIEKEKLQKILVQLPELIKADDFETIEGVFLNYFPKGIKNKPMLDNIDLPILVPLLKKSNSDNLYRFCYILNERRRYNSAFEKEEEPFYENVKKLLFDFNTETTQLEKYKINRAWKGTLGR